MFLIIDLHFFFVVVYDIWKDQNDLVFSQSSSICNSLFFQFLSQGKAIDNVFILHKRHLMPTKQEVAIRWFKLNVDGSFKAVLRV